MWTQSEQSLASSSRTPCVPLGAVGAAGELPADVRAFLEQSYPSNHTYRIRNGRLIRKCQLAARYRKILPLYPRPLTSLLDVSCCKGFFVLAAATQPHCQRALGIDVNPTFLAVCRHVQQFVALLCPVKFEQLLLHELASRIDEFGGPFQTVLLMNTYQYLFFGGDRFRNCYSTHREIFAMLRRVCSHRLIFSNRMELEHCEQGTRWLAAQSGRGHAYNAQAILAGASEFFISSEQGRIGRRPILLLSAR